MRTAPLPGGGKECRVYCPRTVLTDVPNRTLNAGMLLHFGSLFLKTLFYFILIGCHSLITTQILHCHNPPSLCYIIDELLCCLSTVELLNPIFGNFLKSLAKALPCVDVPFLPNIPCLWVDEHLPIARVQSTVRLIKKSVVNSPRPLIFEYHAFQLLQFDSVVPRHPDPVEAHMNARLNQALP